MVGIHLVVVATPEQFSSWSAASTVNSSDVQSLNGFSECDSFSHGLASWQFQRLSGGNIFVHHSTGSPGSLWLGSVSETRDGYHFWDIGKCACMTICHIKLGPCLKYSPSQALSWRVSGVKQREWSLRLFSDTDIDKNQIKSYCSIRFINLIIQNHFILRHLNVCYVEICNSSVTNGRNIFYFLATLA